MPVGFLYGIASGVFFGLMGYLVHSCAGRMPPAQVAFFRSLFACLALAPWAATHLGSAFSRAGVSLWTRSVCGGISALCYFWNLQASSVGTATALGNLAHVFVAALGWRFRNLQVTRLQIGGIALAVVGALSLSAGAAAPPVSVLAVGISGALTASIAYLALREAAQIFSTGLVVWAFGFGGMVASLLVPGSSWLALHAITVDPGVALRVAGLGLAGLLGQFLMTRSFLYLPAHIASVLSLSSLIWGVLLEMWLDHHRPSIAEWSSYGLVVLGIALLKVSTGEKPAGEQHELSGEPAATGDATIKG